MGTGDLAGLTEDHVLPEADFDEIARGDGSPEVIHRLVSAEYSRRLLLVRLILDLVLKRPGLLGPLPGHAVAWYALEHLQRDAKSSEILRDVLLHPQVGVWMSHTLRAVLQGGAKDESIWPEVGQIHCLTFATAIRAGLSLASDLPVRAGHILLPTLGLVQFAGVAEDSVASATTSDGIASFRLRDHQVTLPSARADDAPAWWALRRLQTRANGQFLQVSLDDIDPFRDLADPIPPVRLPEVTVRTWSALLEDAWHILTRCMPGYAESMPIGLRSLVPLPHNDDGIVRSASTGDGFGSVLLTRPADPTTLAVTLVHEFQHTKLGGLLHLTDLYDDDDRMAQFYAPWRDDARPFVGLMQGVYAFLGITAFWRSRHQAGSDRVDEVEFAHTRRQAWTGMLALRASPCLTALGSRFVSGMIGKLQPWMREPVSAASARAAWWASADHWIAWRLRNLRPNPHLVEGLIRKWFAGGVLAVAKCRVDAPASRTDVLPQRRVSLFKAYAQSPDRLDQLRGDTNDPDVDLVRGDIAGAMSTYRVRLGQDVGDRDAWSGLVMASIMQRTGTPWRALWCRPELVLAVCAGIRRYAAEADPLAVAAWLENNDLHRIASSSIIAAEAVS